MSKSTSKPMKLRHKTSKCDISWFKTTIHDENVIVHTYSNSPLKGDIKNYTCKSYLEALFLMNICVQIVLCFLVYVSFYRIYSNSQAGTSSYCDNEDIDDMNETIKLEPDIEGLEEILSLPCDILEALNRESEGSKPNIEET